MLLYLVKKNFMVIKTYLLIVLAITVAMPLLLIWMEKPEAGIQGFVFLCVYSMILIPMSIAMKDYQCPKAATLLSTSPYSRGLLVVSMYITCAIAFAADCIIFWLETLLIEDLGEFQAEEAAVLFVIFALIVSVFIPFLYKFGYEKFRVFQIVLLLVFCIGVPQLMKFGDSIDVAWIASAPSPVLYAGVFLTGIAITLASMGLSISIYRKMDLA